ncbi:nuclease-related domain-containing protein [Lentibacillus salicampi]|uniref:NERD domain-containing protein n=1 Tax=Lentibacillus salicampi TaxID=175306 RepID=A0A4Y9AAR1_9BACI|nr:nuclease-related domain-containing protein [Lentibacillus salicampi]TFJ92000.1 NERD domain-containing protein [Lentibacillus salicampi]
MLYKPRTKPAELQILSALNTRMTLSTKDRQHFFNLSKGYEGEVKFDALTEKLQCDCYILNDLLLQANNATFQIDTLIITAKTIYIYEVKNHEGEYYYESEKLFKLPQYEIVNPLHQSGRSESLLRQLLLKHKVSLPIEASVVFINPEFTLYQAPLDKPIILPTQVKKHLSQLNSIPSALNEKHKRLADKLCALHIQESPYQKLPSYTYEELRKGIPCLKCHSLSTVVEGHKLECRECCHKEALANTIMRAVKEFMLLFPKHKITTRAIHDWCRIVYSHRRIQKVLNQHFTRVGSNRWIYYK